MLYYRLSFGNVQMLIHTVDAIREDIFGIGPNCQTGSHLPLLYSLWPFPLKQYQDGVPNIQRRRRPYSHVPASVHPDTGI